MAISDLGKRLRQAIKAQIWPFLLSEGFADFGDLAAWRTGERWIDCVQIETVRQMFGMPEWLGWDAEGRKVAATPGTFKLLVGTYYTDVHLLPWMGPVPKRPIPAKGELSRNPTSHRTIGLARSKFMGKIQGTLFYVQPDGGNLDEMVEDALKALSERGIPWLERTHDLEAYIRLATEGPSEEWEEQHNRTPMEVRTEHGEALAKWLNEHGVGEDGIESVLDHPEVAPLIRAMQDEFEEQRNLQDQFTRDHPPYDDELLGLLLGSGRPREALELLRIGADPKAWEERFQSLLEMTGSNRSATATCKRELRALAEQQEHLRQLEELLSGQDEVHGR